MRYGYLTVLGFLALGACKKEDVVPPPPPPPPATYTVGGNVTGLSGSVTLANNGGDVRTVAASGAFTFATALQTGAAYSVTITTQPANQTCTLGGATGTVAAAAVTGVTVTCANNTFTVGGTVTGLAGTGLVLQNNAGDNLTRAADGVFTFATAVTSGGAYNVTVLTQPATPAQTCAATNNTGTVAANVTTVTITCVTTPVSTVGSAVIGPAGGTVNGFYGAQIIVPPGALATPVTIGLSRDSSNSPEFAVPDIDAVGATYELTPHGQAFSVPVTLRIPFDPAQVPNDADPALYKAEVAGTFAPLTTTVNGNFLETTITNFSWVMPAAQATRPRMVYAVRNTAGVLDLVSHRIDRATGGLSNPTSSVPVGDFPTSVVAHPSGRFVYMTNAGLNTMNGIAPNSVTKYGVSSVNGQLLASTVSTIPTRAPAYYKPTMPVVHPSGKFLYVMNFGSVSNNAGGDIDMFAIDGSTGALTLSGNAITGNGSQPMGIAFNRLGTRAYVLFNGSTLSTPLDSRVAQYDVNLTTGAFTGPHSTIAATVPGNHSWAIAIDPNERALYVANLIGNDIVTFGINATTGALTNLGSLSVRDRPAMLAADSFGRFIFTAKQQPFFTVNALSFSMNATTGALSTAGSVLAGCPGACTGPISLIAEPQGNFVYAVDSTGTMGSMAVNSQTGALTLVASSANAWVPLPGGIGFPFKFAASGTSPVWQTNCTHNCGLTGVVVSGGGGGSGTPPTNPSPPTSHFLTVTVGAFFGYVTSTPAGIDYGPPTINQPIGPNQFQAGFPVNTTVTLCTSPPPQPSQAYDQTWTGSCSGTGQCTGVHMNGDKSCHVEFTPRSLRVP